MRPLVPILAALAVAGCGSDAKPDVEVAARKAAAELIHAEPGGEGIHTNDRVRYDVNPPVGGPHAFVPAQDGNYAGVEPPRVEAIVHALEHGRIVFQYRKGLPAEQVAQLEKLFDESPHHVLLVENRTDMPCDVAATAWGHALRCKRLTPAALDALRAFRDAYVDKGPEAAA